MLRILRVVAALALAPECNAAAEEMSEAEMEASFLCKFLDFVKWPASAKTNAGAPVVLGVLGEDPFGAALERVVKTQTGGKVLVTIRRSRQVDELRDCRIVFVCRSEKTRSGEICAALAGSNTLTVSDSEGFARSGGIIGFKAKGGSVGIEVNRAAAQREGLVISSRLLKLATVIEENANPRP